MTPYYDEDGFTLYHGDCLEVLDFLPAAGAHLVIADPPYFRVVDEDWDDQWGADPSAFLEWIGRVVTAMERVAADRATLGVFCSHDLASGVEMEVRKVANFLNHIVWRKPGPGRLGRMDKESMRRFFPSSERIILAEKRRNPDGDLFRFRDHVNHSVARDVYAEVRQMMIDARDSAGLTNKEVDQLLGRNGMAGHYFGASQWSLPTGEAWEVIRCEIERRGGTAPGWAALRCEFDSRRCEFDSRRREFDSRRCEFGWLSDVWTFAPPPPSQRFGHPTSKPVGLMAHMIATMSRPGDLVIDPFVGSGSTLRAAKDLGRRAVGIDKDERWLEVTAKRLAQCALGLFGGDAA